MDAQSRTSVADNKPIGQQPTVMVGVLASAKKYSQFLGPLMEYCNAQHRRMHMECMDDALPTAASASEEERGRCELIGGCFAIVHKLSDDLALLCTLREELSLPPVATAQCFSSDGHGRSAGFGVSVLDALLAGVPHEWSTCHAYAQGAFQKISTVRNYLAQRASEQERPRLLVVENIGAVLCVSSRSATHLALSNCWNEMPPGWRLPSLHKVTLPLNAGPMLEVDSWYYLKTDTACGEGVTHRMMLLNNSPPNLLHADQLQCCVDSILATPFASAPHLRSFVLQQCIWPPASGNSCGAEQPPGLVYKGYVIGDHTFLRIVQSHLPHRHGTAFDSQDKKMFVRLEVSTATDTNAAAGTSPSFSFFHFDEMEQYRELERVGAILRKHLQMDFFGFDVIVGAPEAHRVGASTPLKYLIDINYFPSYKGVSEARDLVLAQLEEILQ